MREGGREGEGERESERESERGGRQFASCCVCVRVLIAHRCTKSADVHEKVLLPAFTRSLLDPFPPGRIAALMSLTVTMEYYNAPDIARRLLPSVGMCAVDPGFFFVHYNAPDIARRLLPRLWVFCAVDAGFFWGGAGFRYRNCLVESMCLTHAVLSAVLLMSMCLTCPLSRR